MSGGVPRYDPGMAEMLICTVPVQERRRGMNTTDRTKHLTSSLLAAELRSSLRTWGCVRAP
eukprot:14062624-Alexandrium_andersonii.AAC.1